jgi:class 3 adenylate cyclase
MNSEIRYARNKEGQSVAYQVTGDGPLHIVLVTDWVTNLEVLREEPTIAAFLDRLASFSRLVLLDKRGSGLSDPVPLGAIPTPEEWMDDVLTVLDDMACESAALFGHAEGGPMSILFAATYPKRTTALLLADTCARRVRSQDYPHGIPEGTARNYIRAAIDTWGTGRSALVLAPDLAQNPRFLATRGRLERLAMSPAQFAALYPTTYEIDVRPLLPAVRVPTLVLHRRDNPYIRADNGRFLAQQVPGARYVELEGDSHLFHAGDCGAMLDAVQQFLTGTKEAPDIDRVLATVLFTDIVASTELLGRLGDRGWRDLLERHHALVRNEIERFRGKVVDTAGDGFFATFDGPARAVRCALAIRDLVQPLGIEVRAGVHTGEVEISGPWVRGIAVHIGARVMSACAASQVLVSRTVRDLVAGSGLNFEVQGSHQLKGVEGEWELFSAS